MEKVRVCVIGAGRAGMIHALNFRTHVPEARLVAVVDPFESALADACRTLEIDRRYLDYRQALEAPDIDAVVIVTPTIFHREIAVAAAEAGKHILCEKPMAMDESECDAMIEASERCRVHFQMAFMRRFDESYRNAWECVAAGEIGDVVMVRSNTRGPSVPQTWMYDLGKSNGPLAEVNSHDIDTLRWFTGSEFSSLYAIGGNYRSNEARSQYPDFYDNVVMTAGFENGMQGCIDGAQGVSYAYDSRTEILGTHGCIFIGRLQDQAMTVCMQDKTMKNRSIGSWRNLYREAYIQEDIHFARCVREGVAPSVTGLDGKMAVQVVRAGNRSIAEKCIVRLR